MPCPLPAAPHRTLVAGGVRGGDASEENHGADGGQSHKGGLQGAAAGLHGGGRSVRDGVGRTALAGGLGGWGAAAGEWRRDAGMSQVEDSCSK